MGKMPDRYLTTEEMWELVSQAAQPAIAQYGIKDVEGFVTALLAVAYAECGTTDAQGFPVWDSQSVHDNGQGFGCFALHNQGYAGHLTKEQRLDPATNAGAAAMKLGDLWRDGESLDQNLARMTGPQGQNPLDPQALLRNAQAAAQQFGRMAGGIAGAAGQAGVGGFGMAGQETAGQGTAASEVIPWMTQFFRDKTYTLESGATLTKTAEQQASDEFADDPMKWISFWRSETGQEAGVTEAEEATTAYTQALTRQVIEKLGGNTYEQGRQRILDRIDQEHWTAEQAISEFNSWMTAALEAGKRAETVYGEEMKRKVWTTPEEYYPGTEPGGPRAQWTEKYGVPYTPSPGIAVETLPSQEQMYSRWHQNLGISQQAPPTQGGWSGQGVGQGKGYDAAMAFLQKMGLQRGAAPAY